MLCRFSSLQDETRSIAVKQLKTVTPYPGPFVWIISVHRLIDTTEQNASVSFTITLRFLISA